jgi:hypothetical protein
LIAALLMYAGFITASAPSEEARQVAAAQKAAPQQ